ncbi:MAG: DUF1844 domain-containing protein [Acidobacteriaceae bacterium]|nr:DUF1844 domain-containing protein [Acidobacteriaceae bacterium]
MSDKPFVINDRRKFTAEGEFRPDVPHEERAPEPTASEAPAAPATEAVRGPQLVSEPEAAAPVEAPEAPPLPEIPAEQLEQARRAYDATVDRLDTAVRAMDPGGKHLPPMTFDRLVQSLYMQALIQLGGAPEPGQPAQVDLMGARSTVDMLNVLAEKTKGNLSPDEEKLLQTALFEGHMGFLEVTQALSQQAAQRNPGAPGSMPPVPGGPSIVR